MIMRGKLIATGLIAPTTIETPAVQAQQALAPMPLQPPSKKAHRRAPKHKLGERMVAVRNTKVEAEARAKAKAKAKVYAARQAWFEAKANPKKPARLKITKEQEQALRAIMEERERAERQRKLVAGWTDTTTNGDAWRDGRFEYGNR